MNTLVRQGIGVLVLMSLFALPGAHGLTINFNNPADLSSNFVFSDGNWTPGSGPSSAPSGGLGGTAAVSPFSQPAATSYCGTQIYNTSFPLDGITPLVVSMYFQEQPRTESGVTGYLHTLQLGILDSTSAYIRDGFGSGDWAYAGLEAVDGGDPNLFYLHSTSQPLTGLGGQNSAQFNLVPGNWYKLEGSFLKAGSGNISVTTTLYNSDANGNLGSAVATLGPFSYSEPVLDAASTVYTGFRGYGGTLGAALYDHFSVGAVTLETIPEPSTVLLLGLGVFWLWRRSHSDRCSR